MANSITYEVITSSTPVRNRPNHNAKILGYLYQGNTLEVISINNQWAYFKFNKKNAYINISDIQLVQQVPITGNLTIEYIDTDSQLEIQASKTYTNLELKSYTYTATEINGYKVYGDTTKTITLTSDNPNQTITFYYEEILGSINIKYIDSKTSQEISTSETYDNLPLLSYTYTAKEINYYEIIEPKTKSVILTEADPNQTITFSYKKIVGDIIIKYINSNTGESILNDEVYNNLSFGSYNYTAKEIDNYTLISENNVVVDLSDSNPTRTIIFEYKINIFIIDLEEYNISNDNTNAIDTTNGINQALIDAKTKGYTKVQLPAGHYAIDTSVKNPIVLTDGTNTWTHNRQGISMQSDMELILEGAILEIVPCEDPYYSILTISNCSNSKITGGTILGDRDTHDYGMRINENGDMFESGNFDSTTGEPIVDDTKVRTKDFISVYRDWFTGTEETLPSKFYIIPLWNTTMNTVDGGCRYIYCYDKDDKYLGLTTGGNSYISQATLIEGTEKIKISIKSEKRTDIVLAMTKRTLYYTYEFGSGLTVADSNNIEINGVTIKSCIGDCICTIAPPLKVTVDNLNIINCNLENSRRQGISFVATGESYLVKDCNIGNINGTDPQSGIDFEHYDYIKNVVIDSCNFYDNKKLDIINYNGQDIEIKNSTFDGGIGSTFGWNMDIHDNKFSAKSTGSTALNLNTNKTDEIGAYFKVYNNTFENYTGYGTIGTLKNSVFESNTLYNCKLFTVTCRNLNNKFYNSDILYSNNNNLTLVIDSQYENCTIGVNNDSPSIEFKNCTLQDTMLNGRGATIIESCTFNMTSKSIINGWKTSSTDILYKNCNINSYYSTSINLLGSNLNTKATFESCVFNISRYTLALSYGTLTFNSCQFKFNELNQSISSVDLNKSGYGFVISPWYFNNCYFESTLPVRVNGGNVINPTINGNIIIS